MGSPLTITNESSWLRLKRHFSESFSGELVYRRRAYDVERVDDQRVKRWRNAYRYILLLLAVILLPMMFTTCTSVKWYRLQAAWRCWPF